MDMNNLNNMFPKRQISPAAEFGCICLAAVLATAAVIGYAVFKISEYVCDLGRTIWVK